MAAVSIGTLVKQAAEADNPLEVLKTKFHYITSACMLVIGGIEDLVKALLDLAGIHIEGNPITQIFDSFARFASEHFDFSLFDGLSSLGSVATNALSGFADILSNIINFGSKSVGGLFDGLLNGFDKITDGSKKAAEGIQPLSEKVLPTATTVFDKFAGFVGTIGDKIAGFAKSVGEKLPKMFEYLGSPELRSIIDNFNAAMGGGLLLSLRNFVETLRKSKADGGGSKGLFATLKESIGGISEKVSDTLDAFTDSLSNMQESIKANTIVKIAISVGLLAGSIALLASLDSDKVATGIAAIATCFGLLVGSIKVLDSGSGSVVSAGLANLATSLIKLSVAVGIIAISVKVLSSLKMDELKVGLAGVIGVLAALVVTVSALSRFGGDISKSAKGLITLAVALGILTISVKSLAKLEMGELQTGLIGVGALLGELAIFSRLFSGDSFSVGAAVSILGIALALKVLSGTVTIFSTMDTGQMMQGLGGVAGLLASIAVFSKIFEKGNLSVKAAVSILLTVTALKLLSGVVSAFAQFSDEGLMRGLSGVAALMLVIAEFSKTISNSSLSVKAAVSIGVLVLAVSYLSDVVTSMGGMSWEQLSVGLVGLAGSVVIMVAALSVLSNGSASMLVGAVALTVMSVALRAFVPVMQAFAAMKMEDVAKGLGKFALAIGAMVVSSAVLAHVAPLMFTASAAIAALGASLLLFGASTLVVSAGITAFSVALTALSASIVTNVGIISVGVISLMTSIGVGFVNAITQGFLSLASNIPIILTALAVVIHAIGDFIVNNIPYILSVIAVLVTSALTFATSFIPQVVILVTTFVITLVNTIVALIPVIAQTLVTGAITLINSLANGIRDNAEPILAAVRNILSSVLELLLTALADLLRMIPGVGDMLADKVEAGKDIVQKTLAPETLESSTKDAMNGAAKGVEEGGDAMADAAATAATETKNNLADQLTGGAEISGPFMDEIISSFTGANGDFANAGGLNIESYIDEFGDTGLAGQTGESVSSELLASLGSNTDTFASTGDADFNAYIKAFNPTTANQATTTMGTNAGAGAGSGIVVSKFRNSANTDVNAFKNSISRASASGPGKNLGYSGASGAGSTRGAFASAGSDVASGFNWSGVASWSSLAAARSAGHALGRAAINGAKAAINSGSPSKEAMKLGRWTSQGFAIGIKSLSKLAYDESVGLGQQSLTGIQESVKSISKYVDADMDLDPTIRPVLDLSDVQNGLTQIDGMFNRTDEALLVGFGSSDYANRVLGSVLNSGGMQAMSGLSTVASTGGGTISINVNLQYDASADANELARGIARAVQPYVVRGA